MGGRRALSDSKRSRPGREWKKLTHRTERAECKIALRDAIAEAENMIADAIVESKGAN